MKGKLTALLESGWRAGSHQLPEGGAQSLGFRIFHRDKVGLGMLLHVDPLHLALLPEDVERMLLQGAAALHLRLDTASITASSIASCSSSTSCQAVLTAKARLVLEAGQGEAASKGSSTFTP